MVYHHVTLKIRYGKLAQFHEAMGHVVPVMEKAYGWKLVGAWDTLVGRLFTVIDLWEIPDANSVQIVAGAYQHPEIVKWGPVLAECIEEEVFQLLTPAPYSNHQ